MPSQCVTPPSYLCGTSCSSLCICLSLSLPCYLLHLLVSLTAALCHTCHAHSRSSRTPVHAQQLIIISCSFQAVLRPRTTTSRPSPPLLPPHLDALPSQQFFTAPSTINFTFCDLSSHKLESRQRLRLAVFLSPSLFLSLSLSLPKICYSFARVVIVFPSFCVATSHVAW